MQKLILCLLVWIAFGATVQAQSLEGNLQGRFLPTIAVDAFWPGTGLGPKVDLAVNIRPKWAVGGAVSIPVWILGDLNFDKINYWGANVYWDHGPGNWRFVHALDYAQYTGWQDMDREPSRYWGVARFWGTSAGVRRQPVGGGFFFESRLGCLASTNAGFWPRLHVVLGYTLKV